MTSLLMKSTSADKDTLHEQDQPLKKLAYVSNHRGPLLSRDVKKAAATQFKLFNGLADSGAITMPEVAEAALVAIKTLFGRFK